jgi:hypothetical protein
VGLRRAGSEARVADVVTSCDARDFSPPAGA